MALQGEGMKDEFENWLADELTKGYVPFGARPLPVGAPYRGGAPAMGPRWLPRGLAARTAVIIAAVSIGLLGTTVLAAAAVTGSSNPQVWGQYIDDVVTTCKSQLGSGQHGIGNCVSTIARQKGAQERDQHSRGPGAGQNHPGPGGPPSGVPSGRPTGLP